MSVDFFLLTPLCADVKGQTIVSCDADGVVKMWDVRMVVERGSLSDGGNSSGYWSDVSE